MNIEDHDLLIKIANDTSHTKEWCQSHTKEDDERHRDNLKKFDMLNKVVYGGIGVVVFVEFMSKFLK